jgi:PAS domain S-box-containing protein
MSRNSKREKELEDEVRTLRAEIKALKENGPIQAQERLLLQIMNRSPFTIWACDRDFIIRVWNRKCEEVYGFSANEALGKSFIDLFVDGPEKSAAKKDTVDIIDHNKRCESFLAYDNDSQGVRRTMLTNCFRVFDNDVPLQAEIGLRIDDDLNLPRHKLQRLRELGAEEQAREQMMAQAKQLGVATRLESIHNVVSWQLERQILECEAFVGQIGATSSTEIDSEIAALKLQKHQLYQEFRQLDDALRKATSLATVEAIEKQIDTFLESANKLLNIRLSRK